MTRRLIVIDLSDKEYRALRRVVTRWIGELNEIGAGGMEMTTYTEIRQKMDDAWDAKGREGRGLCTKLIRME